MSDTFVLASASPRRALILRALGLHFRVVVAAVDETIAEGESPRAAVERLARAKADAVAAGTETAMIVAADTVVVVDGAILGKPASVADAAAMLRRLSGRDHEVLTGLCLRRGAEWRSGVETTIVRFAAMSDDEIAWYAASDEPMDKAGAYHIDGRGALFVTGVVGSPSNVAGLPIRLLYTLAAALGLPLAVGRRP